MEQLHICIIWILINIYLPVHLHKIISSGALMSMKIVTFATNVTVIIPWSQWKNKPTTGRKYPHPQYSQYTLLPWYWHFCCLLHFIGIKIWTDNWWTPLFIENFIEIMKLYFNETTFLCPWLWFYIWFFSSFLSLHLIDQVFGSSHEMDHSKIISKSYC